MTPAERAKLVDRVVYALPELTDLALVQLADHVDGLPRRPLDSKALADAQAERERQP